MKAASLGAHTFGFVWSCEPEQAFAEIAGAGFDCVQLMATPPHFDPWREDAVRTRRLRAALESANLDLLALDLVSSDINLASASADVVAFAVDAYKRAIVRAAELGAPAVCIGSGRRHALFPAANMQAMDSFRRAFADIRAEGLRRGVKLLLENHPMGLLADAASIEAFLAREGHDEIKVIYDVANAFAIDEAPAEGIARLARRLDIVHVSDAPRGAWRHDPIGSGDIDFAGIGAALDAIAFPGRIVLEIIAPDPLAGLIDGVAHLRRAGWNFPQGAG